jgi:uncharacterized protein YbcC (UPF0753/DUF2309 family)
MAVTPARDPSAASIESRRRLRPDLASDIAKAVEVVAPLWPLSTFVAVNPLLGLTYLDFEEATALARRWLRARTHLSVTAFRQDHAAGLSSEADLRRAICEFDPKLSARGGIDLNGQTVSAVDLVLADLMNGPDSTPRDTSRDRVGRTDVATLRAASQLIAAWCAVYTDEAGASWPMPHRDKGFFRAWRLGAAADLKLRRLAGPKGIKWLAELPDDPLEAMDIALDWLEVDDRVAAIREHCGRLPGWAGYARWNDEWAPPADHRHPLHLVDLLAAQVVATATAAHGTRVVKQPPEDQAELDDKLLADRVAAVLGSLGLSSTETGLASAVRDVLGQVSRPARKAIWLDAQESNFRDRLLSRLSRPAPAGSPGRPEIQAVFCIDTRSEGLRRHLEACGPYDTHGFAGFFGVPVRWRQLGSPHSEPRCPPLLEADNEVVEKPLRPGDEINYLAAQRVAGAAHEAFHVAKGSIQGPFSLAEGAGYIIGPISAAKTLAPGLIRRISRVMTRRFSPPATEPAIEPATEPAGHSSFGLPLDTRAAYAEGIVRTMGLTAFGRLVVMCGHGSYNINNPHASSYDCGACGGAPGGPNARVAAAILNDSAVRAALAERQINVPADTYFIAAQHDTVSDVVTVFDRHRVPETHRELLDTFEKDVATAGANLARERARNLPGSPRTVRARGYDWAQVRPEWGLAGNAAFIVGPRSMTAQWNLACRVFLHSYDADFDSDGKALETIMTAPLVVGQWISAQYYFSATDPDQFGAGDKTLHNPVGGIGVMLGEGGDLQVGLPAQAIGVGHRRLHQPLRLLAVIQAPLERIDEIIARHEILQHLFAGKWMTLAARAAEGESWSVRHPTGVWRAWEPADPEVDYAALPLELP